MNVIWILLQKIVLQRVTTGTDQLLRKVDHHLEHCWLTVLPGSVLYVSTMKMFQSGVGIHQMLLQTCLLLFYLMDILARNLVSIRPSIIEIQHL